MSEVMVTTSDNPYDYFNQFDEWFAFDCQKGYFTCNYLARVAYSSDELSETEEAEAIEAAVDEIVRFNLTGNYKKVWNNSKKSNADPENL